MENCWSWVVVPAGHVSTSVLHTALTCSVLLAMECTLHKGDSCPPFGCPVSFFGAGDH